MVEILQVIPESTIEAVKRQLAQMRADRVIIELPEGWAEFDNEPRLRLVQRQAQIQRCHLGIVTRNETVRKAAHAVGIPVFARAEDAVKGNWRMWPMLPLIHPRFPDAGLPDPPPWRRPDLLRREARPNRFRARQQRIQAENAYRRPLPIWLSYLGNILAGLLIVLLLLGFIFYVLPAATITLSPGRKAVAVAVAMTVDPNLNAADIDFNQLPGRYVETNIEEVGAIVTTGSRQKAAGKARGEVVFTNSTRVPVQVPAGTIVATGTGSGVNFRTLAAAFLPDNVGARVTVQIEAVEAGIEGNVPASAITTVGGGARAQLSVINPNATSGGGAERVAVVTQADRDALLAQVQAQAEAKAVEALQAKLESDEWLPPESVQTVVVEPSFSKFNDEEAPELSLSLRVLVRGVAVNEAEARAALIANIQKVMPAGGKLVADSLATQRTPGATYISGGALQFTTTVGAEYVVPIDPTEVRTAVAGLTPEAAIALLQQQWLLERAPEIYQDPDWWDRLPVLGRRIQVRVEYASGKQ